MEAIAIPMPLWWRLLGRLYAFALRLLPQEKQQTKADDRAGQMAANLSKNRIEYNALRTSDELSDELAEEGREDLSFVWDAVKELPVQFREVVHLHYYEGYSTEEIAKILQRNPSTVRSDLRRGREKLKTILQEGYDFEV